jgi:hypothetical protein
MQASVQISSSLSIPDLPSETRGSKYLGVRYRGTERERREEARKWRGAAQQQREETSPIELAVEPSRATTKKNTNQCTMQAVTKAILSGDMI